MQDLAENHLDGVFYGSFPSGNGINGSDFVAELQAYHDKVFAPQTIIGTASAANGGVGGARVNPVHSGVFVPAIPTEAAPDLLDRLPARPPLAKKGKGQAVVKIKHGALGLAPRDQPSSTALVVDQQPSQGPCASKRLSHPPRPRAGG